MRHANVSIFIPNLGCKHNCSFCNQHAITGSIKLPTEADVAAACETAIKTLPETKEAEIAYFGGSFTAIDKDYMLMLLESAFKYIKAGYFKGIRISTRPDAIDSDILNLLKKYSVTAIELGAQSMDDNVLRLNNRGHRVEDVANASTLIKEHGFELGLQMMTRLYGDSDEGAIKTAQKIAALKPDTVRIYPTITIKNTALEKLYKSGKYIPQTLSEAVSLCSRLLEFFYNKNIPVIRLGLHTINESDYIAGPWHPAFRELCESEIYYKKALNQIQEKGLTGIIKIYVNNKEISKMTGQKKINIERLKEAGFNCIIKPDSKLCKYEIETEN